MTVILDPGTDANSYLDGLSRAWRTTAGLWKADSTTWQTRANTAYDSGTWGTGSTWQSRYNSEVTLYNNEVTAYNNEVAAYNAALAYSGAGSNEGTTFGNTAALTGSTWQSIGSWTCPRTGVWVIHFESLIAAGDISNYNASVQGQVRVKVAGSVVATGNSTGIKVDNNDTDSYADVFYVGTISSGQSVAAEGFGNAANQTRAFQNNVLHAYFVPTQTYPH